MKHSPWKQKSGRYAYTQKQNGGAVDAYVRQGCLLEKFLYNFPSTFPLGAAVSTAIKSSDTSS